MLGMKNLFMTRIQDELDQGQFNVALCLVTPVHSQVTSLSVLTYYLRERKEKGAFVSVIRPHYYIQRLLVKEGLNVDDITFLDVVGQMDRSNGSPAIRPADTLATLEARIRSAVESIDGAGFLVFDNVSGLLPYMPVEDILHLVERTVLLARTRAGLQIIFLMDHDSDPLVVKGIEVMCDKQFEISPSFFR